MKKLSPLQITKYFPFLILICLSMDSCVKMDDCYDYSIFDIKSEKKVSIVDLKFLDCLEESNQKIIELSNLTFDLTKDVKTLQILVQIRKNHQKVDFELKKLTQKNLIILPRLTHHIYLNSDSVRSKKGELYLLKTLDTQLTNQMIVLDRIDKTTSSIDFRIFAVRYKKIIENDNKVLLKIINDLK